MNFPQAFPLVAGKGIPAVPFSDLRNCRPSSSFHPDEVYGLCTGKENGIFVVDLDIKNGKDGEKALDAYAEERGVQVPETYTVRTKSGGYHHYFAWDEARPVTNRTGVLSGVDVRGYHGYVKAGGIYRPITDGPIAEAPEWLYELILPHAAASGPGESAVAIDATHPEWEHRLAQARTFLANEPPCIAGQEGQQQIWKVAMRLMRTLELPIDTAIELLGPYNAACVPPWSDAELRRQLLRAATLGSGPTGTFSGSFLAGLGKSGGPVPAPFEVGAEWRQRSNPDHQYTEDLSALCAGALQKTTTLGPKELGATFSGPGAPPPWTGVWQYDEFRRRVVAVNPPFQLDAEKSGLSRRDLASVQVWISCHGGKTTIDNLSSAIDVAARQAEFHPVREYLGTLPKIEKVAALEYFTGIAGRLWGATDRDALESGHLMRFAVAAVRRIRVPGTKVDTMLVLAGEQRFRKSAFCERLFGEFFLDQLPPIMSGRGHEASIAIEGRWGIEIGEMHALAQATEGAKKDFLARRVDKYRPVFGVAMQEVPRQCVFIGTTNDDDFLSDPTGDRRYDICAIERRIDEDAFDRDAFWAAAVALEAHGVEHWRDPAPPAADAKSGEALFGNGGVMPEGVIGDTAGFVAEDPWTDDVVKVARSAALEWPGLVTVKACLTGLAIPLERQDGKMQNRVKAILRRAFGPSKVQWLDGRAQRCYRT